MLSTTVHQQRCGLVEAKAEAGVEVLQGAAGGEVLECIGIRYCG